MRIGEYDTGGARLKLAKRMTHKRHQTGGAKLPHYDTGGSKLPKPNLQRNSGGDILHMMQRFSPRKRPNGQLLP